MQEPPGDLKCISLWLFFFLIIIIPPFYVPSEVFNKKRS